MKDITTKKDIVLLVNTFYQKVQKDELIGPIFQDVAQINWDKHLPIMYSFWESLLFNNSAYKGNAMRPHIAINEKIPFKNEYFDRWLSIFNITIDELFEGELAHTAKTKALSIATMIKTKTVYSKNSGSLL